MSEILLLHTSETNRSFGGMPPLGLSWIASFLESKGFPADLVDMQISHAGIDQILQSAKPRIVGLSGTTHTRFEAFELARRIKHHDRQITVLFGGPHATFTADDTLRHVDSIDVVVRGEGEYAMLELADYLLHGRNPHSAICGISYRQNGHIVHTPSATRIGRLDDLPLPKRVPGDIRRYDLKMDFLDVQGTSIITSRGCPVGCTFCSASIMFGKTVSYRSARAVVDEIQMLVHDFGFGGIKIFDSTFTLRKSHVESICAEMVRRKLIVPWECEVRVNTVTKDLLRIMRSAGCYYISFGIESGSNAVLKKMHKNITTDQAEAVLTWARELGIKSKVFFTFGHIGETMDDAKQTFRFMESHRRSIDTFGSSVGIRIYPGTAVEGYAKSIGCLSGSFSWSLPYEERRNEELGADPTVPILLGPGMGWDELRALERRHILFWMKDLISSMRVLRDQWRLHHGKKWWGIVKGLVLRGRILRKYGADVGHEGT